MPVEKKNDLTIRELSGLPFIKAVHNESDASN